MNPPGTACKPLTEFCPAATATELCEKVRPGSIATMSPLECHLLDTTSRVSPAKAARVPFSQQLMVALGSATLANAPPPRRSYTPANTPSPASTNNASAGALVDCTT